MSTAVFDIRRSEPEAIAMISTYKTSAEFIRQVRALGLNPIFLNLSILGTDAFVKELGQDSKGVLVSQVLPSPWEDSIALIGQYRSAMDNYASHYIEQNFSTTSNLDGTESVQPSVNFISLEGYVAGRFLIAVLETIKGELTREKLVDAIYSQATFDIAGLKLEFSEDSNQGLHNVYMTALDENHHFFSIYSAEVSQP